MIRRLTRPLRDLVAHARLLVFGAKSAHSQTNEDAVLSSLFASIGIANRRSVEICAGDGIVCNTAALIVRDGWEGLLVDGNRRLITRGRIFHRRMRSRAVLVEGWVTRSSINALISGHGFTGEIDLLSLDLDGVDYWIWEAIEAVTPRVVVLEYQDILGPERSWTIPYSDDFSATGFPRSSGAPNYAGASLRAFVKLGRKKGYRLVAINELGYNAFFVRNDLGADRLPELDVDDCFGHPHNINGMTARFGTVAHLPWQEV